MGLQDRDEKGLFNVPAYVLQVVAMLKLNSSTGTRQLNTGDILITSISRVKAKTKLGAYHLHSKSSQQPRQCMVLRFYF
jgi:hypothetical protein